MFALKAITNNVGYQQIATLTASTGLTIPTTNQLGMAGTPRMAMIQCTGKDVRWRDDGVAPTSSVGMTLVVGDSLMYDGELTKIRFIESSSAAVLNVSYYE